MAIRSLDDLRTHLQWAIEVEHATIPPYLCALYSIKPGRNREAAQVVASVVMEEMLHMTLAANLLNAVGGRPRIDAPQMLPRHPVHLPHSGRAFQIALQPLSPEAIETFLRIERPAPHDGVPEDDSYETIGQFYEAIEIGLVDLVEALGAERVFCGDPGRQVGSAQPYGGAGEIIEVRDLDSALAALEEIVEQGEGLDHQQVWDGDREMFHPDRPEVAHYFRFQELLLGRRYAPGDTPAGGPTGPRLEVDWEAIHRMRPNPHSSQHPEGSAAREALDRFNRSYSGMLHLLERAFDGSPGVMAVAVGQMYGVREQAAELMEMPCGEGEMTVGPSFEYVPPERRGHALDDAPRIAVVPDGPYLVYGGVPLLRKRRVPSEEGHGVTWQRLERIEAEETYALCRCGRSEAKPFCDGSHARLGFEGSESAETAPTAERSERVQGTGVVVGRDRSLCMHAGFCVARRGRIAELMAETGDPDVRAQVIAMVERCPSGSFTYALEAGGEDLEQDLAVAIAVTDEGEGQGSALWVTGGIPLTRADGAPFEVRNRVTLCRCGHSGRKPLCDGTHREVGFTG